MTYFGFLFLFLVIPLFLLLGANWLDHRAGRKIPAQLLNLAPWIPILIHVLVALVYTTPWDNYLVATGVWYYHPEKVTGITLGWVPIEEYTFFVLESLLAGLWLFFLARRLPVPPPQADRPRLRRAATLALGLVWIASVVILWSRWQPGIYLGLILAWALPPIMLQFYFGADILWRYRRMVGLAIGSLTLYLAATDSLAIGSGIWTIDPLQSLPILIGGVLPIEEFIFFLMTSTLLVFGITLAQACESKERAQEVFRVRLRTNSLERCDPEASPNG